ncbi:restriction endonuclease [Ktedonobacteria bacterium brp13]|nr:restriction endonuclease [Ktedonobacteria bacterium brp13]
MSTVGQPERSTQDRVLALFVQQLGYRPLGNWQYRQNNSNVEEAILRTFLKEQQGYSDTLITKALYEFNKVVGNQVRSLYDINKDVYTLLRYGVKVKTEVGENTETVWLINWDAAYKNDFAIAEEVSIQGENNKRPDVVLYVNGIALGVLELKSSVVSVSEGIRQNLGNQNARFIKSFFNTIQLVMAGNDTEGLRYGTTGTSEKYYLTWKEESTIESPLDRSLLQLCAKERLLEIIHDFTIFDAGTRKLCRPNQYFGVRAAQQRVSQREGGIIWHSQGSGKSLTMVWLAKWLREHISDARVLIITDRTELDEQIQKVFRGVEEEIYRTNSGKDLITQLNATTPWLICSLIHKFVGKKESTAADFIKELQDSLPTGFKARGDIYVFVDECHRTQSGELHDAMKKILPNAMFIGFTGTPLLKNDKKTSIETFGSYIHTYKFDEAVRDQVVLDLRYEARDIDQNITAQKKIDQWFEAKTRGLKPAALTRLKQRWGTMQKVLSSQSRLEKIVADILLDMELKERLQNGRGNAMLVSGSIYQACKLYELFLAQGFDKCAIVTSYKPTVADIKSEESGEGPTEKLRQYDIYERMLNGRSPEEFEKEVKKKFIEEPGQMKLLIVVDKLLTGFDAPAATYLYIDKKMQDHGLFQAICRVNRLDGEDKEYGYIVDYKDLFKSVEGSIHDYTSEALEGYEKKDVEGLLQDRIEKGRQKLDEAREAIKTLCEAVDPPQETLDYMRYFCNDGTADNETLQAYEARRITLYKLTASLIRAFANLANDLPEAGYSEQEIVQIKQEVARYENVSAEIKNASGDNVDLKVYEPAMRYLIDTYIRAEESEVVSAFDDISLIQLIVEKGIDGLEAKLPKGIARNQKAMAETIENNLRKVIINERPLNTGYYDKMSARLDALIRARQDQALEYKEYLKKIAELASDAQNPGSQTTYPDGINTLGKRAIYDKLAEYATSSKNDEIASVLDTEVKRIKKDSWRGSPFKEREIRLEIRKVLQKADLAQLENDIFQLIYKQKSEY